MDDKHHFLIELMASSALMTSWKRMKTPNHREETSQQKTMTGDDECLLYRQMSADVHIANAALSIAVLDVSAT